MKEGPVDLQLAVMAHDQSSEVSQPADAAFNDPASPIPLQRTTILRRWTNAILLVRADQFDSALLTLLMPHLTKLKHRHFRFLYWVMQQLLAFHQVRCDSYFYNSNETLHRETS